MTEVEQHDVLDRIEDTISELRDALTRIEHAVDELIASPEVA